MYFLSFLDVLKKNTVEHFNVYALRNLITATHLQSKEVNSGILENSSEEFVDVREILDIEKINIRYQTQIEETMHHLLSLWEELLKKRSDLRKIFALG